MLKPIIVTFYSFRGGVGRSMAMLNTGCLLAQSGRRVLLVDFDLEAPGLTHLIDIQQMLKTKPKARSTKGLVDILYSYLSSPASSILNVKSAGRRFGNFLVELNVPKTNKHFGKDGSLHLMPAGRQRHYEKRLDELYMSSREFKEVRKAFAIRFRRLLLDSGRFDYIFVDARTGYSDEGYIAAKFLCDHLIVLSGLNDQNIKGTAEFLTKVAAWNKQDHGPERILLVASPVCEYEDDRKQARYSEARSILKKVTGVDMGFTLTLPYHPRLSLYEELVALQWPDSGLGRAYKMMEYIIRDINEDTASHWAKRAREALERRNIDECAFAFENLATIDRNQAVNLARQTSVALARLSGEDANKILPIFNHLEKIDPDEPLHPLLTARVARNAGLDSKEVLKRLDGAAKLARKQENQPAMAAILEERAKTLIDFDYAGARDAVLEALKVYESLGDKERVIATYLFVADAERKLSNYTSAMTHAENALSIAIKLSQKEGILSALNLLALIESDRDNYDAARKRYKESLKIGRELGDRASIRFALHGMADIDYCQNNWKAARKQYEESLKIAREMGSRKDMAVSLSSLADLDRDEGNFATAQKRYVEALDINRQLGDRKGVSKELYGMALLDRLRGNYDAARKRFEESLKIRRELCNRADIGIGNVLHCIADVDRLQGKWTAARKGYEESLRIDRKLSNRPGIAMSLHALGELERSMGNYKDALKAFDEALKIHRETTCAIEVFLLEARREAARVHLNTKLTLGNLRYLVNRADSDPDQYVGARAFLLLGSIEMERCYFKKAFVNLVKARDKAHRYGMRDLVAFSQAEQALCLSKLGQKKEAAQAANAALKFFKLQNVRHPHAAELEKLATPPAKSQRKKKPKSPTTRPRKS